MELIYSVFVGRKTKHRSHSAVTSEHLDRFWTYIQALQVLLYCLQFLCLSYVSLLALVTDEDVVFEDLPKGKDSEFS